MNRSERRCGHGVADILAVLERDDAGKADERTGFQNAPHPVGALAEAMKNTADFSSERFELRERVLKGVTLVDDAVQPGFGGDFELLLEDSGLFRFVTCVIGRSAWSAGFRPGVFHGVAFSRRVGDRRSAKQAVIIQADFTNGDNFGMFRQFTQRLANIVRRRRGRLTDASRRRRKRPRNVRPA